MWLLPAGVARREGLLAEQRLLCSVEKLRQSGKTPRKKWYLHLDLKCDRTGLSLNACKEAVIRSPGQWLTSWGRFDKLGRKVMPNAVWRTDREGESGADTAGRKAGVRQDGAYLGLELAGTSPS